MKKLTQGERILKVLREANGSWVSSRIFKQEMFISECNARISELRKKGHKIETGENDEYGFSLHRIDPQNINKVVYRVPALDKEIVIYK